ncbi:MAG: hypothetical protein AB7U61_15650 [Methylocystis sp.]
MLTLEIVTLEMETRSLWLVRRELMGALRDGDAETARLAREELEAAVMHSDFPSIRETARQFMNAAANDSNGPAIVLPFKGRAH